MYARYVESSLPGPDIVCERNQMRETVRRLMRRLPEEKRIVLRLVHERDLSVREASEILGIPDGTVKSRLHYGRKTIGRELRRYLEGE